MEFPNAESFNMLRKKNVKWKISHQFHSFSNKPINTIITKVFATLRHLQLFEHQAWQWSRKQLRVFLFSNVCQPKRVAEYKFKYAESLATFQQLGKKIIHMRLDCMKLEIWTI